MIIIRPYEPKIYPVVPRSEWREPSLSMPRDQFGNPEWRTVFVISAKTMDGKVFWKGYFDDRDDADAFLYAGVTRTLRMERALHDLPSPIWSPGFYPDELIIWHYAVTTYYTSGTSTTIPSDWNNANNTITGIGGGGNGTAATFDGKSGAPGNGGGGAALSIISNQTYTPGATRTRQIGGAATDTFFKADNNSTNALVAKGGENASGSGLGGSAASGTGSTKYSGGNGAAGSGADGGGGGGAAGSAANGSNGSSPGHGGNSGDGASGGAADANGANGTGLGSGYGSGAGGGGGTSGGPGKNGGNYGGAGAGGSMNSGAAGNGIGGLLVVTHTPVTGTKAFRAMSDGW